jgi:hypothetical protein
MKKVILSLGLCLAYSQCLHAQWTQGTSNNIYTTNSGNTVTVGGAIPTTINASSLLFPSAIPKVEILSGAVSTTYSELFTMRHTGIGADPVSRQMGIVFKLSGESTANESNKMGGMLVESNGVFANNPTLSLLTANTRRLTIDYNGSVGVGTPTPLSYFHGGNNRVLEIFNPNTILNSQSHIVLSSGSTLDGNGAGTLTWVSKNSSGFQGMAYIGSILQGDATTNASSKLVFATSNGTAVVQRMFIDKDGNVGIGTSTPREALSVNGNIRSKQVVVESANWPDYVFKPTYQLPSLADVKAYIDRNQHLPETPSEQEVIKNGLNIGEMNKLLMKKVEELTLYLIEKDKQAQAQQAEIDELKTQMKKLIKP